MKIKIKRKKHFKQKYIFIIIAIILIFIGTSYSLLSTTLYINGRANADFNYSIVPVANGSNYSSNTGFTTTVLFITNTLFDFVQDVREDNMLTTEIKNGEKFWITSSMYNTTFTITLKNNSPLQLTNGSVTVTDGSDSNMNPSGTPTLGSTTLAPNGTTTFRATIGFSHRSNVAANSYITYNISYKYNNITVLYKYRVLVVS